MKIYSERENYRLSETIDKKLIPKNSPVFEALGTLDELGSFLGLVRSEVSSHLKASLTQSSEAMDLSQLNQLIMAIQRDLIALSGEVAGGVPFATTEEAQKLESLIDQYSDNLPSVTGFILPGDNELSARLHVARTATRRAERIIAAYDGASGEAVLYINRLSDLLFILSIKFQ